jgi:MFS transporter, UMF1 family
VDDPRKGRRLSACTPPARGAIAAFCLYDAGDSAYATTILSVLFNQYFAEKVAGGAAGIRLLGATIPGATVFTWLVSITMIGVAVMGPLLGAWTDRAGTRMRALRVLVLGGGIATIALTTVGPGEWIHGGFLFVASYACMALASVLYNAVLPELGSKEEMGRISGIAWGIGYLGGGVVLVLNLLLLSRGKLIHLAGIDALHLCFALAGIWWIVFALPLLARQGPRARADGVPAANGAAPHAAAPPHVNAGHSPAGGNFRQVLATLRLFRKTPHFLRFMIAYLLYNDGVQTIVATASIFAAAELGFSTRSLVMLFLLIQGTAFIGAPLAGWLADRTSHKRVILIHIVAFIAITIWARWIGVFGAPVREFWWLGGIGGLFLGGIQSVSRSLLARWIPEERSGEIFGFFAVAGRFASAFGPLVFGAMSWAAGGLRPAILSISLFFVIGGALLLAVDERTGEEEMRGFGSATGIRTPV